MQEMEIKPEKVARAQVLQLHLIGDLETSLQQLFQVLELTQGVAKRCRLAWLTTSPLVYEPKLKERQEIAGSQPMNIVVNRSPYKQGVGKKGCGGGV
jgi:hypothetical protein